MGSTPSIGPINNTKENGETRAIKWPPTAQDTPGPLMPGGSASGFCSIRGRWSSDNQPRNTLSRLSRYMAGVAPGLVLAFGFGFRQRRETVSHHQVQVRQGSASIHDGPRHSARKVGNLEKMGKSAEAAEFQREQDALAKRLCAPLECGHWHSQ